MPLRRAGIPSLYFGLCSESIELATGKYSLSYSILLKT
ncbi:hypothetical protein T4B_12212 [Trichinella pseudospiralis]|uniref:Uncharacterized protein n=1 Tax=Trichinella pseudospiralis TaxID=6337 RepID=A0A0V1GMU5_TRIPS|nr:hypothetical protein T4B_12212 [Trichinella pseudospiralis]